MTEPVPITSAKSRGKRAAAKREPTGDWRDALVYKGDKLAAGIANVVTILSCDERWRGVVGSNTFAGGREVLLRSPPWDSETAPATAPELGAPWTDQDDVRAAAWLQRHWSIPARPEAVGAAIRVVAQQRPVHPIVDYLDDLRWDGTRRVPTWLTAFIGAPDTEYTRAVGQWWLTSAVARVRKPGCKADHVLVLEGPQGKKKSTALRVLTGEDAFTDELPELGSKDSYVALAGRWIVELAELDQLNRSETSRVKAFLSATVDRYRPPYGRRVISVPRQCVFAGTVTGSEYLRDDTGNRRFWPVAVGEIDLDKLEAERDQLWAEADEMFRGGARWWPAAAEVEMVGDEQEARFVADVWEATIASWLTTRLTDFTVGDVLGGPLGIEPGKWTRADQMRVASCLKRLGCVKRREMQSGNREWRWSK